MADEYQIRMSGKPLRNTDLTLEVLRTKWLGKHVAVTNVIDGKEDSAAGVVVDISANDSARASEWPYTFVFDWGFAIGWRPDPETTVREDLV